MLILTRRVGEILRIGKDVSVQVMEVNGSQVRLGVTAPKSVAVHREEVFRRIARRKSANGGGIRTGSRAGRGENFVQKA